MLASPETRRRIEAVKAEVRAAGYAWLKGHFIKDIRGAGAPIFDSQGELVAVLAIAGPGQGTSGRPRPLGQGDGRRRLERVAATLLHGGSGHAAGRERAPLSFR